MHNILFGNSLEMIRKFIFVSIFKIDKHLNTIKHYKIDWIQNLNERLTEVNIMIAGSSADTFSITDCSILPSFEIKLSKECKFNFRFVSFPLFSPSNRIKCSNNNWSLSTCFVEKFLQRLIKKFTICQNLNTKK
jgi:hypothetical protein